MYADAVADVKRAQYVQAEKKLVAVQELLPRGEHSPAPATLLLSRVYIHLGRFYEASEMALKAIGETKSIVRFVGPADIKYMIYVGKILYERATFLADTPKIIDVSVTKDDLEIEKIRTELAEQFPIDQLTTCGSPHPQNETSSTWR